MLPYQVWKTNSMLETMIIWKEKGSPLKNNWSTSVHARRINRFNYQMKVIIWFKV